ncbi:hypothetical protein BaRGS_00011056, partial [Batillaria attramentaria]
WPGLQQLLANDLSRMSEERVACREGSASEQIDGDQQFLKSFSKTWSGNLISHFVASTDSVASIPFPYWRFLVVTSMRV